MRTATIAAALSLSAFAHVSASAHEADEASCVELKAVGHHGVCASPTWVPDR